MGKTRRQKNTFRAKMKTMKAKHHPLTLVVALWETPAKIKTVKAKHRPLTLAVALWETPTKMKTKMKTMKTIPKYQARQEDATRKTRRQKNRFRAKMKTMKAKHHPLTLVVALWETPAKIKTMKAKHHPLTLAVALWETPTKIKTMKA